MPRVGIGRKEDSDFILEHFNNDRPGEGHGTLLQYSCLENSQGQRSLAGYSLWGCNELDMTEQLSTTMIGQ